MEKAKFYFGGGKDADEFYVLEETKVGGTGYILVADSEEEDGECLILRQSADTDGDEYTYEIVEDDTELLAVGKVFAELLEDIDIEM